MRLLNVVRSIAPMHGGVSESLRQTSRAATALGHDAHVLTLDPPRAPWLNDFPASTHALGPTLGRYGYTSRLAPWLEAHGSSFDAVVVHGLWQYHGLAVRRTLRPSGRPYHVMTHGMLDPWFKRRHPLKHLKKWLYWPWADYRLVRDARTVFFTSDAERRAAADSFWLYRARPVVVGLGIKPDAEALASDVGDFHRAYPATRERRNLVFLGRLHPKKGCDLLIGAFAALARHDERWHLVMAGPDPVGWQRVLVQQADALGITHRITWTGMLSGALKWSALRAADAFVLPSHQENFGIAVAEALSMGVPVLVSRRVDTWREIVAAGAGLADTDTLEGTTALLHAWAQLPERAQDRMRDAARTCFAHHFEAEACTRRFIDALGMSAA